MRTATFIWGIWWSMFKLYFCSISKIWAIIVITCVPDDAHGTAIMLSAEKEGVRPEEFIERVKQQHIADFEQFNISYDHYYSTHSDENRVLSEHIYTSAHADGGIIKKDIQQYFDEDKGLFWRIATLKERVQNVGLRINMGMPVKNAMQRTQQRI